MKRHRLAVLVLTLSLAATAAAQDRAEIKTDDLPGDPSILTRFVVDARRRSHLRIVARLQSIAAAESRIARAALVDEDADGVGEFAGFQELTGRIDCRAGGKAAQRANPPYLDAALGDVDESGRMTLDGYVYRIWLPGKDGVGVGETRGAAIASGAAAAPDAAEKRWCCYAWPAHYPATGRLTYFVDETGAVLATDALGYGGRGPRAGAAFAGGGLDSVGGATAPGKEAQDGHVWKRVEDLSPTEIATVAEAIAGSPWRDENKIAHLLLQAIAAVEKECGTSFGGKPNWPKFRIATWREVRAVLDPEMRPRLVAEGTSPQMIEATLDAAASSVIGKCELSTHRILVVPETIEVLSEIADAPWLQKEDALLVVLFHEATHALDLHRFPLAAAFEQTKGLDAREGLAAALEGHAEFVAERIALEHGLAPTFVKLCAVRHTAPAFLPDKARAVRVASSEFFAYERGLAFFQAVFDAQGAGGVDAVLASPPISPALVQRPSLWINGRRDDPGTACKPLLLALVPALPDGFDSRTLPFLVTDCAGEVGDDPGPLEGYEAGQAMFAQNNRGANAAVRVLAFDTPEHAARFVAAVRASMKPGAKSAAGTVAGVESGAGAGGKLPGISWRRSFDVGGAEIPEEGQMTSAGRFVISLDYSGGCAPPRVRQDSALEKAVAAELANR